MLEVEELPVSILIHWDVEQHSILTSTTLTPRKPDAS